MFSPVGVVKVPLLVQALTQPPSRAGQGEVSAWEPEGAVLVGPTGRLLRAGVVQVRELQLTGHGDELPRLEVQQPHGAQRGPGQEVEEPDQVQTHLESGTCQNLSGWLRKRGRFNKTTVQQSDCL